MIKELPAGFEQRVVDGLDPLREKSPRTSGAPASHLKDDQIFALLMNGNWKEAQFESQSEADLRLCGMLAAKCGYNRTFVDIMFRHSGLMRDKWDASGGYYSKRTLDKVLEGKEVRPSVSVDEWQKLFHTQAEALALPEEVEWVVRRIANKNDIILVAGLPKCGKSWLFTSLMKALLAGTKWLDEFEVMLSCRVIYLVPEISLRAAVRRLRKMGLIKYLYDPVTNPDGPLFVHTLTKGGKINLTDEALLAAAKDADVFVDPLIRYIEGDENSAAAQRLLSDKLLAIASVARCLFVSHHSPKAFEGVNDITTQNAVRGTGEFGAMASIIFGVLKLDNEKTRLHIKCTDARDDEETLEAFEVEGRPHIDETGDFVITSRPGKTLSIAEQRPKGNKGGRDSDPQKEEKLAFIEKRDYDDHVSKPLKAVDMAALVNAYFELPEDRKHSASTIRTWRADVRASREKKEQERKAAEEKLMAESPLFKKEKQ